MPFGAAGRLVGSAVAILGLVATTAAAGASPRLVVKYRDADAASGVRQPFLSSRGGGSHDLLHAQLGIRDVRPLFRNGTPAGVRDPVRAMRAPRAARVADLARIYVVELPAGRDVDAAAAELAADPHVVWAHPDHVAHADLVPDDPLFASQWGLAKIDAQHGWDTADGTGAVIAVVDTGTDRLHPDLVANLWTNAGEIAGNGVDDDGNGFADDVNGWDFVADDASPDDRNGHGTHVAGIAAAATDNALGVAGLGFGSRVMTVKGLGDDGFGSISDLAAGIVYAAENGADVINNSWSGLGIDPVLVDAIDTATALGVVVVAAAGNAGGSADGRQPAGIPQVIAVGASTPSDGIASFSNHGSRLSVAAPGTDVLSLRSSVATGLPADGIVQQRYQRLSGTSMASPHVAGLAAVLLSAFPALQPPEVRWHLELNAVQPGYPGWEGEPWNPYFGWGRIDAAHVFDPVAVTTRLTGPAGAVHGIGGAVTPGIGALDVAFTTLGPVPWTVTSPSWLPSSVPGGTGDGPVAFDLDASGLVPGTVTGPVVIDAPSAVDGGATRPVTAYIHRDERVGAASALATNVSMLGMPGVATDGVGSVVVWENESAYSLELARIDGAGTVSGPVTVTQGFPFKWMLEIAFDGRNYLLVWFEAVPEGSGWRSWIKGMRIGADGTPVDATPFTIAELRGGFDEVLRDPSVAFDGQAFMVVWERHKGYGAAQTVVYARRVGSDGTLRGKKAVQLYPDKSGRAVLDAVDPQIGCANGRCLVAWSEFDAQTAPDGHYVDKGYGVVLADGVPLTSVATRLMNDVQVVRTVAGDGTDFLIAGTAHIACPGSERFQDVAVATRVTRDGVSLDPDPIRLDRTTPDCPQTFTWDAAFDGTSWVVPFAVLAPKPPDLAWGYYLFAARLAPDGTLLDDEVEGLLLHDLPRIHRARLAVTQLGSVVGWTEHRDSFHDDVLARRVLPRATTPSYPSAVIGAIGSLAVDEGQDLVRTIHPPAGFAPATTVLSATGLPPGALFDAPTGALRWRPSGTEAGVYPGVTFTAVDGVQTASETISIVVDEAIASISGLVRLENGTPVTDVGIDIKGIRGEKPVAFPDRDGRYRMGGLVPKTYVAKLDRGSRKRYRALGRAARATLGTADATMPDIVVVPR